MENNVDDSRVATIAVWAKRSGMTAQTIRNAVTSGKLKGYKVPGGRLWFITPRDWSAWITSGETSITPPEKRFRSVKG